MIAGVEKLTGRLDGQTFLEVGSGSGLHGLAALRLGAKSVFAFDYDAVSVATTRSVLTTHAKHAEWIAVQGDILAPIPVASPPLDLEEGYD